MTLSEKKRERIKKMLKDGEKWDLIKSKEKTCYDTINRIHKELSSSPPSTTPQADKKHRVQQDHTNQKQQPTTTPNTPDPHVQRLEEKLNDVDLVVRTNAQQFKKLEKTLDQFIYSQQTKEITESNTEKPEDKPNPREETHQDIKTKSLPITFPQAQEPKKDQDPTELPLLETRIQIHAPSPLVRDGTQTTELDLDQTDEPPQERKKEYVELNHYHLKMGLEFFRELKKYYNAYQQYKQTGVYTLPSKNENEKKEIDFIENIPLLKVIPKSKKQPQNNLDSESVKNSSNDEVNTNIDQISGKEKDLSPQKKDDR